MHLFFAAQPVIWVDLVFASVIAAAGLAGGWVLTYRSAQRAAAETLKARAALRKMHDLASSVAADVGEHQSRVQEINSELHAARDGDSLDEVVVSSVSEILAANERLQNRLADAEVKLQQQAEEIETQTLVARTDQLTQLWNRRAFDDELSRRFAEWHRRETPFSLLMIDVDHFKKFNDTHGHQAGDEVLRSVAKALSGTMRELDMPARFGGEEFAVVLPATGLQEALRAAERAQTAIHANTCEFAGRSLHVTASIGVATIARSDNAATVLKRTDDALYAAKHGGRDCIYFHDGQQAIAHAASEPDAEFAAADEIESIADTSPATAVTTALQVEPAELTAKTKKPVTKKTDTLAATSQIDVTDCETFTNELGRRLLEFERFQADLSLVVLAVDRFEEQSAEFGPNGAKLVSRTVFEFLNRSLQGMAVLAETTQGRFLALLPGTDLKTAAKLAERFRRAIAACEVPLGSRKLGLTVSVGLAQAAEGDDSQTLVRRADEALQASIEAGGNCSHVEQNGRIRSATPLAAAN